MSQQSSGKFSLTSFIGIFWVLSCGAVLAFRSLSETFRPGFLILTYCGLTLLLSVVSFVLFGVDKRRASRGTPRISEKTLHLTSAVGGWPGSLIGRSFFRHKTMKVSFRIVLGLIVGIHLLGAVGLAWMKWGPVTQEAAETSANEAEG